jgi:N-formylglutamate deformylase
MTSEVFTLRRAATPLLISFPHVGTRIPAHERSRYTDRALAVEDTDWFVDRLFGFAASMGAGTLVPHFSRYLIDLNRPTDPAPMYPGRNNTELCPTGHFSGEPLYRDGRAPGGDEIAHRIAAYWMPYHEALGGELQRLRAEHGHAVLLDAHSIRSELPWLFAGTLPHLNLGTADGASCDVTLRELLAGLLAGEAGFTHVVDGRFKGGYITRAYGRPAQGVHAVQLEIAWRAYMAEEPPYRWEAVRAAGLVAFLRAFVGVLLAWRPA